MGPTSQGLKKANLVSGALTSGFEYIKANGAALRLEIVVEGVEHLNNEKISKLLQDLAEMVSPHIDFVSTAVFPFESEWQACLDYITAKDSFAKL